LPNYFGPAQRFDKAALVGMCAGIGGVGIEDSAQSGV
jgi:hypothetical protein